MAKLCDIVNVIEELKTTQRLVLESVRQILNRQTSCTCPCHTRDSTKDAEIMESRVKELEENEEKKEIEIRALKEQLQSVRNELNSMKLYRVEGGLETVRNDLESRVGQCPSNPSASENAETDKTISSQMVQNENVKDGGSRIDTDNEMKKNENLENTKQKPSDENKPNLKNWTGQKPEVIDDSPGGINLPKFDSQRKPVTHAVTKPNFNKKSLSESLGVRLVEQTIQRTIEIMDWHRAASMEETQGRLSGLANLQGLFTVVCVDISYSMTQGDAWQQAKTFFKDFTDIEAFAVLQDILFILTTEETGSAVSSVQDLRLGVHRSDSLARPISFRGLMIVIAMGFIPLLQLIIFLKIMLEISQWPGLQESSRSFNITEESVALVTFGHKTEVLKRLTNDFSSLQMAFDGISLGGPSPMYGGLLQAVAAARASSCSGGAHVNGIPVATKIILITDGHPTDTNLVEGPDELTPSKAHETNAQILETMENMDGVFDVFCVPVGNANIEFLQLMTSISNGKMITYKDGWKIGQRLRKTLQAGNRTLAGLPSTFSTLVTESDREDIQDILERAQRRAENMESVKRTHCYNEMETDRLPEIGSRVLRGPDWKSNNQDGHGPGTVIGQAPNEKQIWIEWDENEHINVYNYDASIGFEVLIEDVPRWPKPNGRLAVGCLVKPGVDWKNNTRNVKVTDTGVVIQIIYGDKVKVRWKNKEKGDYSYGMDGIFEVEFSPPERTVKEYGAPNPASKLTGAQGHPRHSQEDQYYVPQSQISQPRKDNAKTKFRNKNMN